MKPQRLWGGAGHSKEASPERRQAAWDSWCAHSQLGYPSICSHCSFPTLTSPHPRAPTWASVPAWVQCSTLLSGPVWCTVVPLQTKVPVRLLWFPVFRFKKKYWSNACWVHIITNWAEKEEKYPSTFLFEIKTLFYNFIKQLYIKHKQPI